jgi:hypothetical protein
MKSRVKPIITTLVIGGLAFYLFYANQNSKREYAEKIEKLEKLQLSRNKVKVDYNERYFAIESKKSNKTLGSVIVYTFEVDGAPYKGNLSWVGGDISELVRDSAYYLAEDPSINAIDPKAAYQIELENEPWNWRLYLSIALAIIALPWAIAIFNPDYQKNWEEKKQETDRKSD